MWTCARHVWPLACASLAACEPIALPAVVPRDDAALELDDASAARPPEGPIACRAGTFRGRMLGMYRSEPAGLCGLTPGPAQVLDLDVVFSLVEERDEEFYTVSGGCMRVPGEERLSSPEDSAVGLSFALSGTADCSTGRVAFQLRGTYLSTSVCTFGASWARYFTTGLVEGRLDATGTRFVDAAWTLRERVGSAGGSGTFTAELDADAGAPDLTTERDCFGADFRPDLEPQPVPSPR